MFPLPKTSLGYQRIYDDFAERIQNAPDEIKDLLRRGSYLMLFVNNLMTQEKVEIPGYQIYTAPYPTAAHNIIFATLTRRGIKIFYKEGSGWFDLGRVLYRLSINEIFVQAFYYSMPQEIRSLTRKGFSIFKTYIAESDIDYYNIEFLLEIAEKSYLMNVLTDFKINPGDISPELVQRIYRKVRKIKHGPVISPENIWSDSIVTTMYIFNNFENAVAIPPENLQENQVSTLKSSYMKTLIIHHFQNSWPPLSQAKVLAFDKKHFEKTVIESFSSKSKDHIYLWRAYSKLWGESKTNYTTYPLYPSMFIDECTKYPCITLFDFDFETSKHSFTLLFKTFNSIRANEKKLEEYSVAAEDHINYIWLFAPQVPRDIIDLIFQYTNYIYFLYREMV